MNIESKIKVSSFSKIFWFLFLFSPFGCFSILDPSIFEDKIFSKKFSEKIFTNLFEGLTIFLFTLYSVLVFNSLSPLLRDFFYLLLSFIYLISGILKKKILFSITLIISLLIISFGRSYFFLVFSISSLISYIFKK